MKKGETIEQYEHRAAFEAGLVDRIRAINKILRAEIEKKKNSKSYLPGVDDKNSGGEFSGTL